MNNAELIGDVYERFKALGNKDFDYNSFYVGWIEGRVDLLKKENKKLIKEYAGSEFCFLLDFLDGGYEQYVSQNLDKITMKKTFGKSSLRNEYKNIPACQLEQKINEICENTINYAKNNSNRRY